MLHNLRQQGQNRGREEGSALTTAASYINPLLCVNNCISAPHGQTPPHPLYSHCKPSWITHGCICPGCFERYEVTVRSWPGVTADLPLSSGEVRHQVTKSSARDTTDKHFLPLSMTTFISNKESDLEVGLSFSLSRHLSRPFPLPDLSSIAHLGSHRLQPIKNICDSMTQFLRWWTCDFPTPQRKMKCLKDLPKCRKTHWPAHNNLLIFPWNQLS